ncbi:hypothetical protein H4S00_003999, partial [Coemansia sp. D1744]
MPEMLPRPGDRRAIMLTLTMTVNADYDAHVCDMFDQLQHLVDTGNDSDVGRNMYDSLCESGVIASSIPRDSVDNSEISIDSEEDLDTTWVTPSPHPGLCSEAESAGSRAVSPTPLAAVSPCPGPSSEVASPDVSPTPLADVLPCPGPSSEVESADVSPTPLAAVSPCPGPSSEVASPGSRAVSPTPLAAVSPCPGPSSEVASPGSCAVSPTPLAAMSPCPGPSSEVASAGSHAVSPTPLADVLLPPGLSSEAESAGSHAVSPCIGPSSEAGLGNDEGTNSDTANETPQVTKVTSKRQTMEFYVDIPPRPEKRRCHLPNQRRGEQPNLEAQSEPAEPIQSIRPRGRSRDEEREARLMDILRGYDGEEKDNLPPKVVEFLLALSYDPSQDDQSVQDFINSLQASSGPAVDLDTQQPVSLLDLATLREQGELGINLMRCFEYVAWCATYEVIIRKLRPNERKLHMQWVPVIDASLLRRAPKTQTIENLQSTMKARSLDKKLISE